MNPEYITLDSRLTIKKDVLTERKLKINTEEGVTRSIAFIALIAFLALSLYKIFEDKEYVYIVQVMLILVWLEPHVKRIYRTLFIKTWRSSIKLNDIQNVTLSPLDNGLETKVTLHLKNGRKKFLVFRNAENQSADFIQSLGLQQSGAPVLT